MQDIKEEIVKKMLMIVQDIYVKIVVHVLMVLMHMDVVVHHVLKENIVKMMLMNVQHVHQFVRMVQHVQIQLEVTLVFVLMVGLVQIVVLI